MTSAYEALDAATRLALSVTAVRLLDGTILRSTPLKDSRVTHWPALQDAIRPGVYACDVCPIANYCGQCGEFDCQVYEMFSGFYVNEDLEPLFGTEFRNYQALLASGAAVPLSGDHK